MLKVKLMELMFVMKRRYKLRHVVCLCTHVLCAMHCVRLGIGSGAVLF